MSIFITSFPQDWCKKHGIKPSVFDSIINKTQLSYRTNRMIGGVAPSEYLAKLEKGNETTPAIEHERLDGHLSSHLIDPRFCAQTDLRTSWRTGKNDFWR